MPETFHCCQRTTADKLEGSCISLRRMSFPCRYSDMIPRFGRPVPELSMITNKVWITSTMSMGTSYINGIRKYWTSLFRHLHRCNSQQRGSPAKVLWIYRRDSSSNLQTLPEPKNSLQWPQEGALFKVPVPDVTKWSHSQLVWPSWLVMENHSIFICRLDVVIWYMTHLPPLY